MRFKMFCLGLAAAAGFGAAAPAQAQLFYTDPVYPSGTVEPGDPLIGEELKGATPAEARAGLIWNLRSGLNVMALRCQYYKYLRAVDTYNGVLAHHSAELASAYKTLGRLFHPHPGPTRLRPMGDPHLQQLLDQPEPGLLPNGEHDRQGRADAAQGGVLRPCA
jgi:hypothetical protein